MRIVILSPYFPWPAVGGPKLRIFGILKELSACGHELFLLAGHAGPVSANPLSSLCRNVEFYRPPSNSSFSRPLIAGLRTLFSPFPYVTAKFRNAQVVRAIRVFLTSQQFDLVFANFAFLADAVPEEVAKRVPVVLDEHESEGLLWRQYLRQANVLMKGFALINLLKLVWFRRRLGSRIAVILCASDREAAYARSVLPRNVVAWTVPNGVDSDGYGQISVSPDSKAIILCGAMGVYRNAQAAIWFAQNIFPKIRREIADAELWVVGASPTAEVRALAQKSGIYVTGTVEDVRPYYQKAAVAVAPYRFGEGTKLKVLEAMACGVPLVSTSIGCQGIEVVDGQHVLIANTERDFARHVIGLLHDADKRAQLADASRRLIEEKYTWKTIVRNLDPILKELAGRSRV